MRDATLASVIAIVCLAAVFDYSNGFHDAANSIATVVSTRVLSPRMAVVWAAFWNFAALLLGTKVAATIAKDVVKPEVFTIGVVFAGLIGAIAWDVITWLFGLPTSSSHALVGGLGVADRQRHPEDRRVHRAVSDRRPAAGVHDHGRRAVAVPPVPAGRAAEPGVPADAAGVGGRVQPGARDERRPEDDGRDPGPAHRAGKAPG